MKDWQKKSFTEIIGHKFFSEKKMPFYSFLRLENEEDLKGLEKVFEVYIERSKIVFKNNTVILWLKAAAGFLLNKIESGEFVYDEF